MQGLKSHHELDLPLHTNLAHADSGLCASGPRDGRQGSQTWMVCALPRAQGTVWDTRISLNDFSA